MNIFTGGNDILAEEVNENFEIVKNDITFGDGSDGDVVISVNTSLTRDMFYNNLTINTGIILNPNGYRIYVKGTLECLGTGKIASNGGNAGNGENGKFNAGQSSGAISVGGLAGVIPYSTGTLPIPKAGFNGASTSGNSNQSSSGSNGVSIARSLNVSSSSAGGAGATETGTSLNNGGTLATVTALISSKPFSFLNCDKLFDLIVGAIFPFEVSPSSGSGGTGRSYFDGNNYYGAGAGGGSGATGGFVWICAFNIINLNVEAKGGDGGNGGNGSSPQQNAGGGGGGGNGGCIMIIRKLLTAISYSVSGGIGGTGFIAGGNGNVGFYKELVI